MIKKKTIMQYGELLFGALLFATAVNVFIEPCGLNTGSVIGLAQLLSYLLVKGNSLTGLFFLYECSVDVTGLDSHLEKVFD